MDQLYHYVDSRQKDRDIFLPTAQSIYYTTVNDATAYTPLYLMFGRECNMPAMVGMLGRMEENIGLGEGTDEATRRCMYSGRVLWCHLCAWLGRELLSGPMTTLPEVTGLVGRVVSSSNSMLWETRSTGSGTGCSYLILRRTRSVQDQLEATGAL